MYEIQPTGELARLLEIYKQIGGIVDYVLIGGISLEQSVETSLVHRAAAPFTIETAAKRHPFFRGQQTSLRMEPDKAQGKPIDLDEFLAPGYYWVKIEDIPTFPYFSPEKKQSYLADPRIQRHGGLGYYSQNYHYAFSYPPYNDQGFAHHEEEWLFAAINQQLFQGLEETLSIYRWTTDWADYFKPGHEWWGSFLWTVYHPELEWVVGIAASASD
jgi:hypothetical protein